MKKEWTIREDQWGTCFYEWRDGKLYECYDDRKEQAFSEVELDIERFISNYGNSKESPFEDIVLFLKSNR